MVSTELKLHPACTLEHMKMVLSELDYKPRHVQVDDVIDFKDFLAGCMDESVANLADSHQIRIAMTPKGAGPSWTAKYPGMPVMQGMMWADQKMAYGPAGGVQPLVKEPQPDKTVMLSGLRPLYCASQPQRFDPKVDELTRQPIVNPNTGLAFRTNVEDVATEKMDTSSFQQSLQKLRKLIDLLAYDPKEPSKVYFFCPKFKDLTEESMLDWWKDFIADQDDIMKNEDRRRPKAMSIENNKGLYAVFHDTLMYYRANPQIRTERQALVAKRDARLREVKVSMEDYVDSLAETYKAPTCKHMIVAEFDSLEPMIGNVNNASGGEARTVILALSGGTDPVKLDYYAGYMGEGSWRRNQNKSLLWIWTCQVLKVISHSPDWQTAVVKVHWYRWMRLPNMTRRWVPAWRPQTEHVYDLPEGRDPSDAKNWHTSNMEINLHNVMMCFGSFAEGKEKRKDPETKEYIMQFDPVAQKQVHAMDKYNYIPDTEHLALKERCKNLLASWEAEQNAPPYQQAEHASAAAPPNAAPQAAMRESTDGHVLMPSVERPASGPLPRLRPRAGPGAGPSRESFLEASTPPDNAQEAGPSSLARTNVFTKPDARAEKAAQEKEKKSAANKRKKAEGAGATSGGLVRGSKRRNGTHN